MTSFALAQAAAVAPQTSLDPGGPGAQDIVELWNAMLWLGAAITVLFVALLVYALVRRRRPEELPPEADRPPDDRGEHANIEDGRRGREDQVMPRSERLGVRWMIAGGVVFPALVLTVLFVFTLRAMDVTSPARETEAALTVEIVGRQWWWEIRYLDPDPSREVVTANELHLPVGQRVRVRLRAFDVIHSFWVPGLQGKTDMIPGRINWTWIEASAPGVWRGQCAEFCGLQHAKMAMVVVAETPEAFARWLEGQRAPAAAPSDSVVGLGQSIFLRSACSNCHTVRGTPALARAGPDLTHVASRLTLAAGELPNTRGNLYGWVANPQGLKPGTRMPAVPLTADELHAVVHYLGTLR